MQLVAITTQQESDNPSLKNVLVHPICGGFWLGGCRSYLGNEKEAVAVPTKLGMIPGGNSSSNF